MAALIRVWRDFATASATHYSERGCAQQTLDRPGQSVSLAGGQFGAQNSGKRFDSTHANLGAVVP